MKTNATTALGKRELTPLEREIRNRAIREWATYGLTTTSISAILNGLHPSTISRILDKTDSE